jgi:uncharacterized protein YjlB
MAKDRPVETAFFADDGRVPNSRLPVIIHRQAIDARPPDMVVAIEQRFAANRWTNGWRSGIYTFHHYHSTSHEVLGIARGKVRLRLGGERGRDFELSAGDVVVLPAGTGHKRLSERGDLLVVGAYPDGRDWDLIRAQESDAAVHAAAVKRIVEVPLPELDPVRGAVGPVVELWRCR